MRARWVCEAYSAGNGAILPVRRFLVAFSICHECLRVDPGCSKTHVVQLGLAPPMRLALPIQQSGDMAHGGTRQRAIGVTALQYGDDLALGVLVREGDDVARVAREEGNGHTAVMPLHRLVFVLACVESGTDSEPDVRGHDTVR